MKSINIRLLSRITMIGDVLLFYTSFLFTILIVNYIGIPYKFDSYSYPILIISTINVFVLMNTFEMYKNIFYRGRNDIIITIFLVMIINAAILIVVLSLFNHEFLDHKKITLLILVITQIVFLSIWRAFVWSLRKNKCPKQTILIYGELENAKEIAQKIINKLGHLFDVKYIYDVDKEVSGIYEYLKNVDHILMGNAVPKENIEQLFVYCTTHHKNVFFIPDIFTIYLRKAQFIQLDDVPVLNSSRLGMSFEHSFIKRLMDIIVSLVGIILTLPIMLVVALLVKFTSPGPVLFKQLRVTIDNKEFNVYKFRTMVNEAEKMTGPVLATTNDSRVTPIGRILRSSRLDEIPQLFNVLLGSMSLIGPRPERPHFVSQFVEQSPEYIFRTRVKAGITGLAQVCGKYTTNFDDKLKYDLMYIKNYSLSLDIKILIKTISVMLNKESSEGLDIDIDEMLGFRSSTHFIKETAYGYEIHNEK